MAGAHWSVGEGNEKDMASGDMIYGLLDRSTTVLDCGCGTRGGPWWPALSARHELVTVDLWEVPEHLPTNATFYQTDIVAFCYRAEFQGYFDLAVADHIFEHVPDPAAMASGINRILKPGGMVHVGIPDAHGFTDRFYHLIYPDGGGHISQLTLNSMVNIMREAGFREVEHRPWPDDWRWFKQFYDWCGRRVQYVTQEDIDYIADTLAKELTPARGYYYGWEIVFAKEADPVKDEESPPAARIVAERAQPLRALAWRYVPFRLRRLAKRVIARH